VIVLPVDQGSPEWIAARLGIPTASAFDRVLTAKTRKPSSAQGKYLCELVAERVLRVPVVDFASAFMARGTSLEEQAVAAYEFEHDATTEKVGFILEDGRRWGCSPDRLVGEDGLLEVKCVSAANHVGALLGMKDDDHAVQCQGQMLVTGRKWVDLYFSNPALPSVTVRYERDTDHIVALTLALIEFCEKVDDAHARLLERVQAAA
jgi:hypothetical protein